MAESQINEGQASELFALNMRCSTITDEKLASLLTTRPLMKQLCLEDCPILTDACATHLIRMERLEVLLLGSSSIGDPTLLQLADGASACKITALGVRKCYISDYGISRLIELKKLQHLALAGCRRITKTGLALLARPEMNISTLDLENCLNVTDEGLLEVAKMQHLKRLNLSDCRKITESGLVHLAEGSAPISELVIAKCRFIDLNVLRRVTPRMQHLTCLHHGLAAAEPFSPFLFKFEAIPEVFSTYLFLCSQQITFWSKLERR